MVSVAFSLTIEDLEVEVIKKRKKNITLYVLPPDGKVRVTAPNRASQARIREFILNKRTWIQKTILKFQKQSLRPKLQYVSGEFHPLWGEKYQLTVLPQKRKAHVVVTDREMLLFSEENATFEQKRTMVSEFYRTQVKAHAPHLLDTWQQRMGVSIHSWQVKKMRSRWGSCHIYNKKINLSLQLAMKPLSCLEYTIIHELCHLLVPNHSFAFYKLLEQFLPGWQERRDILRSEVLL
jgi:predicted metal-dependent hydrolase